MRLISDDGWAQQWQGPLYLCSKLQHGRMTSSSSMQVWAEGSVETEKESWGWWGWWGVGAAIKIISAELSVVSFLHGRLHCGHTRATAVAGV